MDYYKILNLSKEPFSNSPDPEFFFQSRQHLGCLQKLELSLRLRRGLNVVIGDVGTGKTTLCRQLIRRFARDEEIETHLVLDPTFSSPSEFLITVAEMLEGGRIPDTANDWQVKEVIKQYLFRKGIQEGKTVVLIIDEGQKIPVFCLEILREFLNYETNEYKLLQIVIFAQKEFENTLREHANFADRINLYHILGPLNFRDTRLMIQFRLQQSQEGTKAASLFSYPALCAIYRASGGYPRKIVNLCHRSILTMIIQNRRRVGWFLVRSCVKRAVFSGPPKKWRRATAMAFIGVVAVTMAAGLATEKFKMLVPWKPKVQKAAKFGNQALTVNPLQKKVVTGTSKDKTAVQSPETPSQKLSPETKIEESTAAREKAVTESEVQASRQMSHQEKDLPLLLGRVTLQRKETLWKLVEKVYGVFKNQYMKSLIRINPSIDDPDHVEIGQSISVPAIPARVKPLPLKAWWVKIGEKDTLEEAIQSLRSHPDDAPPIRLIPYWNNRQGLKFAIVLKRYFLDEASARNQLNSLPLSIASDSRIFSLWDKETVFFADPFLGRPA